MLEILAVNLGVGLAIMVADKIVARTSNKYDDLLVTAAKWAWKITGGKFRK